MRLRQMQTFLVFLTSARGIYMVLATTVNAHHFSNSAFNFISWFILHEFQLLLPNHRLRSVVVGPGVFRTIAIEFRSKNIALHREVKRELSSLIGSLVVVRHRYNQLPAFTSAVVTLQWGCRHGNI